MTVEPKTIEALQEESRAFPPPPDFAAAANAQPGIYDQDLEAFWREEALKRVSWSTPFERVLEWKLPYAKWFLGGRLNVCYNCVDRHVEAGRGDQVAFYWEAEPADERRTLTFAQLQREVVQFANGLKRLGVGKGTPVALYMGMVPELAVAMLACTRLGAPHTVVFGGFSADALSSRMNDMECQVLITQDEGWRRGARVPLKQNADQALVQAPGVGTCIVLRRTGGDVTMREGRDVWWHDAVAGTSDEAASCPCEPMDAEDLLYLLYTSGTTAKPKGIV
ncbi:MAG TPA: AMP-binding protein, partial [Candidatus Dormibacteraeota bacterium]|nr:AMP-binding protein [Candidatus Dormibacteraeota bacterium]